ncbi:hypothetical protein FQA39_LY08184 [Lamprigera yunnana]|nr:hypothetical protein FQA39_LY08184 [Lamprigera yunnana]
MEDILITKKVNGVELCRRSNTHPLCIIKPAKPKSDVVLDFVADRIKLEDWTPILNALCLDTSLHVIAIRSRITGNNFLYDVSTEEKLRKIKRHFSTLWTDYILRSLIKSLGCCVKNSQVLSCLELDGLPLHLEYLDALMQNLRFNKTIKMLSFKHCPICDGGCQMVCTNLRLLPNITDINLSSCNLTKSSGEHIARIIKQQQINRYSESWHNSLRYEEPENEAMGGIKRLTLNNNLYFGDEGLLPILDVLDDDLWIKAIDMQNCNITENISERLLNLCENTTSLDVADFRNNQHLSLNTVEKILKTFEKKYQMGNDPEYQWGVSCSTMYDTKSCVSSCTNLTNVQNVNHKNKLDSLRSTSSLRRFQIQSASTKKSSYNKLGKSCSNTQLPNASKELSKLQAKLKEETEKRLNTERLNQELQKQLLNMQQSQSVYHECLRTTDCAKFKENEAALPIKDSSAKSNKSNKIGRQFYSTNMRNKRTVLKQPIMPQVTHPNSNSNSIEKRFHKRQQRKASVQMSPIYEIPQNQKNSKDPISTARDIFVKLLCQDNDNEKHQCEDTILEYCCNTDVDDDLIDDNDTACSINSYSLEQSECSSSGSDSSLEQLYREIDELDRDLNLQYNEHPILLQNGLLQNHCGT